MLDDKNINLQAIKSKVISFANVVKEGELREKISELDNLMTTSPTFWDNKDSKQLLKEQAERKAFLADWLLLLEEVDELETLLELYNEGEDCVEEDIVKINDLLLKHIDNFEVKLILTDPLDINGAIVTIHSGAGGTESDDWVSMLFRMYSRWAEKSGFKLEVLDSLAGEVVGFKSITFEVNGDYIYGYLKGEVGIHRLVRISPYDAQNRRHTTFASVSVLPDIASDIDITILEDDLKIDTFRSGGAGGQHVNTTDSAVRITHLPTNIVVTCQNERSQHKNKASAMKILKSKLYAYEKDKQLALQKDSEGEKSDIAWGNQIRSYVLHPYKMVKDLRSRYETSNVEAVLDGELEQFIKSFLLFSTGIK